MTINKVLICPYCGETQRASDRCRSCGGLFEALSRQATHNAMGPWFVREPARPFQPGCSYETIVRLIEKGRITKTTIIRGPTTKQFWTVARRVPGLSHLFGYCHECETKVEPTSHGCHSCGAPFGAYLDRDYLGLPDIRPLPWEADVEEGARLGRPLALAATTGALGLSSFATDEELMGGGRHGTAAESLRPADDAATGHAAAGHAASPASPDPRPDATARMLKRRLERQTRQVRTLTVLLAVAFVAVVGLSIPLVTGRGPEEAAPTGPAFMEEGPGGAATSGGSEVAPGPVPVPAAEPSIAPPADEPGETAVAEDGQAVPRRPEPWRDQLAMVQALASRGADERLGVDERVAAYEEAIVQLDGIEGSGAVSDEELASLHRRYQRAAERLRLRDFYGTP